MSLTAAAFVIAVLAGSFAGTRVVLMVLSRRSILDHPNERSSHTLPTPRGGGLAVVAVLLAAWAAIGATAAPEILIVAGCALALGVLSWLDDLRGLSVPWRLAGQAVAVAVVLAGSADRGPYFAGLLPPAVDALAAGMAWIWFINLFNFMDGIDGIAGVEVACIGAGAAAVATVAALDGPVALYGLTAAAAALGFLWWNWHPARIFLGDVGSIPLGFLLGWLLLSLSSAGLWAATLILPLYYLADTTVTLARRALRGEAVWRAHREHFYQRAVQRGLSHGAVTRAVLMANILLVGLAAVSATGWWFPAIVGACLVVIALLSFLGTGAPKSAKDPLPPAANP